MIKDLVVDLNPVSAAAFLSNSISSKGRAFSLSLSIRFLLF